MNNEESLHERLASIEILAIEQIAASNRTTRAVRAFVRFLFIQLVAATLALLILFAGDVFRDTSECTLGVCGPNTMAQILAGLVWIVGIIWSSSAGWTELSQSEIPFLPVRRKLPADSSKHKGIDLPPKSNGEADVNPEVSQRNKSSVTRKRGRFCKNCGGPLAQGDIACQSCDTWQVQ